MSFKSVPKITEWVVVKEKKTGKIISIRKSLFKPIRHELYVPTPDSVIETPVITVTPEVQTELTPEEELAKLTEERAWLSKDEAKKARYYELKNNG